MERQNVPLSGQILLMSFRGQLSTLALTDVLQVLSHSQKTGALTVEHGPISTTLFLEAGVIASATSTDPTKYLGQFLLSRGLLSELQLSQALEAQAETELLLGRILVEMGILTQERLGTALVEKTEEIVYGLFDWQEGTFEFRPAERAEKHIPVALRVEEVLLKGIERQDQLEEIRKAFPDPTVVLRYGDKDPPDGSLKGRLAKEVYDLINGRRTIAEIALTVHSSEFTVSRFFLDLYRNGFVEVVAFDDRAEDRPTPVMTRSIEEGQALLDEGKFELALEVFRRAQQVEPERKSLRSLVELAEIRVVENAYRGYLPTTAIPTLACAPEELIDKRLTPEEFFLLSRLDGGSDVRALVKISPLREVEVVQILSRLLDQGLVCLGRA